VRFLHRQGFDRGEGVLEGVLAVPGIVGQVLLRAGDHLQSIGRVQGAQAVQHLEEGGDA